MLYYFKKGKNATEIQKKISAVYREGAVVDWTCQKWFAKFHAGDFSLDYAPQSGRPVEVDSNKIETLIENSQRTTMWEMADILKISKSIKLLVKMKSVSFILWKKLNGLIGQPSKNCPLVLVLFGAFTGAPFVSMSERGRKTSAERDIWGLQLDP